jgi:hypothetical protein
MPRRIIVAFPRPLFLLLNHFSSHAFGTPGEIGSRDTRLNMIVPVDMEHVTGAQQITIVPSFLRSSDGESLVNIVISVHFHHE